MGIDLLRHHLADLRFAISTLPDSGVYRVTPLTLFLSESEDCLVSKRWRFFHPRDEYRSACSDLPAQFWWHRGIRRHGGGRLDRKSTRLNSSHLVISYAVF